MTDHDDRQEADDHLEEEELQETAPETDEADSPENDWGLAPPKGGMGKEIKIGLSILTLVCCLFGYVVWQKMSKDGEFDGDTNSQANATAPAESNSGDGENTNLPPFAATTPPTNFAGGGVGDLGDGSLEDAAGQSQEFIDEAPGDDRLASLTEDTGFDTEDLESASQDFADTQGQAFDDPGAAGDDQSEDAFGDDSFSDNVNPYSRGENDLQAETDINAASDDGDFADSTDAPVDDPQDGEIASSLLEEPAETAQSFDDFDPLGDNTAQAQPSDSFDEEFQTPTDGGGEEEILPDQSVADDSLAARTYRGTLQPNQASSQTMVRRAPEAVGTEEIAIDPRSDSEPSRTERYRTVGRYREPINEPLRGESSLGADLDGLNGGIEDGGEEFPQDGIANLDEPQTPQRTSRHRDSEALPLDADDQTYRFNEQANSDSPGNTFEPNNFPAQRTGTRYVIEANDSFWSIARQTYGSPKFFQALAKHNQRTIADPRAMRPGVEIETPSAAELQRLYPELLGGVKQASQRAPLTDEDYRSDGFERQGRFGSGRFQAAKTPQAETSGFFRDANHQPHYRVVADDMLGSIARKYLGRSSRWKEIHRLNRDRLADPNRLKIGTVLRLPADATAPRIVETPHESR